MDSYIESRLYRIDGALQQQAATYAFNNVEEKHYEVEGSYNPEKKRFATSDHALPSRYVAALEKGELAKLYPHRKHYPGIQQIYNDRLHLLRQNYIKQIKEDRRREVLTWVCWIAAIAAFLSWIYWPQLTGLVNSLIHPSTAHTSTPAIPPAPAQSTPALPEVVKLPAPFTVYPGNSAWLQAGTLPDSSCSIAVNYLSGPSHAQGLYSKPADSKGEVRWDWFIGTNTTPGSWPIDVTCEKDGQVKSSETFLTVE